MNGSALKRSRNEVLLVPPSPSAAVRVMVVAPSWLVTGVTVMVRFVPLPVRTMLVNGTSAGLLELAQSARLAAGDSGSCSVKAMGPTTVFGTFVWPGITEKNGGSL